MTNKIVKSQNIRINENEFTYNNLIPGLALFVIVITIGFVTLINVFT